MERPLLNRGWRLNRFLFKTSFLVKRALLVKSALLLKSFLLKQPFEKDFNETAKSKLFSNTCGNGEHWIASLAPKGVVDEIMLSSEYLEECMKTAEVVLVEVGKDLTFVQRLLEATDDACAVWHNVSASIANLSKLAATVTGKSGVPNYK